MIIRFIQNMLLERRKEIPFIIFFFFLLSFILSRIVVISIETETIPFLRYIYIRGIHIHHFAFGIIFLTIAGFLALIHKDKTHLQKTAAMYGIGLGLTFDEFGMWLHLETDYWLRPSYDAIIIIALILANTIYLKVFWKKIGKILQSLIR